MKPLVKKQLEILYPDRPKDVNFIVHVKNEGDRPDLPIAPIRRLLNTAIKRKNLKRVVVGIDDSTTDNTEQILKEFQKKVNLHYFKFTWRHDFSYAKNLLLDKCADLGVKQGEWICLRGGDFSETDDFIKRYDAFTENPDNVIGRTYVPEYSPYIIRNYLSPIIKDMFPFLFVVYRDRIIDWRYRDDIRFRNRAHENMFQDFYILTHMGNYFAKHHGIPLIGTIFHHGEDEDNLELASFKIFYYALLVQLDMVEHMYCIRGDRNSVERQLMDAVSKTSDEIKASHLGYDGWVKFMTKKYSAGKCPEGLLRRCEEMRQAYQETPVYG